MPGLTRVEFSCRVQFNPITISKEIKSNCFQYKQFHIVNFILNRTLPAEIKYNRHIKIQPIHNPNDFTLHLDLYKFKQSLHNL